jgi:hypothetical protein
MTRKPSAAGVAAQHQRAAGAVAGLVEEIAEDRELRVPAVQLHVSYATRSWQQELPIHD